MPELILSVAYAAFFFLLIPRLALFRDSTVRPVVFQALFGFKLLAAIGLYLIYTRFYTDRAYADIFRYFDDSDLIVNAFRENPGDYFRMLTGFNSEAPDLAHYYDGMRNWYNTDLVFNDSRTMIRLCAFLRIFSLGTYFPLAIIFSFLSLAGLTGLFRSFDRALPGREFPLLVGVFLLPSTILWTSGVIKEAVLMFAAGLFLYQFMLLYKETHFSARRIIALLLLAACLFLIKSYFMFLLLPGIVSLLVLRNSKRQAAITVVLHVVYYLALIFIIPPVVTGKKLPEVLASKQQEFIHVANTEGAKSYIEIPKLENSYTSILSNAPLALLRTLARPSVAESHNPLMLLAGIENLLLNIFMFICIFGISSTLVSRWQGLHWSALFLVVSLGVLVGLITPILGAIVRYKVPILPFLVFVMVTLPSGKWVNFHPRWLLK
jgi:hypothetical protein